MELFETMLQHSSVRSFTQQQLSQDLKEQLTLAAQSASSSNFLQAFSIIEITDIKKRKQIEEIANFPIDNGDKGELYIFVADLNKHAQVLTLNNDSIDHLRTMESLVVSVVDATLAAQSMAVYAESVGLGICYVGGIRNNLFQIKELLDLPELTYPVFGLFVGYPAEKNEVKPRLPINAVLGTNTYRTLTPDMIDSYNKKTTAYYQQRSSNNQETNWSEKVRQHFEYPRRSDTIEFLKKQGFVF
ncbi:NADPH-dependent oxidoreductase [Enterococcus sp. AZ196]|uniref:NADPH-dependent oxidoreductase n=1 Tax=Enterococcus sp. AZ196 TaxID=2774659 RepID=UPI003D2B2FB3